MKLMATAAALLFATSLIGSELPSSDSIVERDSARFLVPIAGDVVGAKGEHFRTDLTIVNFSGRDQVVEILWIPRQGTGEPISETISISDRSYSTQTNVVGGLLGTSGVGSLLVSAVNASGEVDPDGEITGFARIYNDLISGSGTGSQTVLTMLLEDWRDGSRAYIHGILQRSSYRTNYGIVNLDPVNTRQFNVIMRGFGDRVEQVVEVGPMSMIHAAVPAEIDGTISIAIEPVGPTGSWRAYASTVDNRSGSGWTVPAMQPREDVIFED